MSIIDKNNLPHTVTVHEPSLKSSAAFGTSLSLSPKKTGVKCWVQLASLSEKSVAMKLSKTVTHKVYFNRETFPESEMRSGNYIEVTAAQKASRTQGNETAMVGKTFRFQVVADGSAGLGILFKCLAEEVELPNEKATP